MAGTKKIGIVGGLGPEAGVDLFRKIIQETPAKGDEDHLKVVLDSAPSEVPDRTAFLTGKTKVNPGTAIGKIICRLISADAEVIGIPCNTAHVPNILSAALDIIDLT